VAMWTPVRHTTAVDVLEQTRPEGLSASLNQVRREVAFEDTIAFFSNLTN